MVWEKKNLVTLSDGTDRYQCSICGFKKKYHSLRIDAACPKCVAKKQKQNPSVFGYWAKSNDIHCPICGKKVINCPREGHPNSKYWEMERNDGMKLFVCSRGCYEDGSGRYKVKRRRTK